MKKNVIMLIMMILMSMFSTAVVFETPTIDITLLNQDPDPAGPGNYVELRFKVVNTRAGTTADDLQFRLEPKYPFSLDKGEESVRIISNLPALGDGDNALVVKYKLRIDDGAVQGNNAVKLEYKHNNLAWLGKDFDVSIRTRDANIAINSVKTTPERIKPGEEATVEVTVKNMADSTIRDVTFKMDLTYENLLGGATAKTATDSIAAFNILPFAPTNSATEQKIESLKPGEEYIFSYKIIAYSEAESRVYKIPIALSYYDELETQYTKNDVIGLIVGTKPDLSVVIDESDLYVGKNTGTVIVRLINKGFSDVKFLSVTVPSNGEYELLSSEEVYIGNVDSDDYETAEFMVYLKNGASKEESSIKIPVTVEYRDANSIVYTETHNLDLKIMTPEKLGIKTGSNGFGFVVVVVLVVAGIFFWRKRRKKKK